MAKVKFENVTLLVPFVTVVTPPVMGLIITRDADGALYCIYPIQYFVPFGEDNTTSYIPEDIVESEKLRIREPLLVKDILFKFLNPISVSASVVVIYIIHQIKYLQVLYVI